MLIGHKIGPFAIDKELGSGAMGSVYRARHVETGERVAIKIIAPGLANNPTAMARFKRESSILQQLHHPNIVRLVLRGKVQNTRFYAMEYIEGESLDRVMARRGRITWEEVVRLGHQLCDALGHAHAQGIVHRDLKPSNLMMLKDGTVKLTDFGIAKDLDEAALTSAHCTVGTAAYMSPEQCRGERDINHKSDLYSLGVMFYELLTGKKPFEADSAMEMFMQHASGTFERPSRLVLEIPIWLDTLICQLMEKTPEKRPYDAATVAAAALDRVKEKVEAQVDAGVDAVRTRLIDRPVNRPELDDDDKAAARELLGKKKKKKRQVPWYQQRWLQGLCMVTLLGLICVVFYLAFIRKPSAEELYRRADNILGAENKLELHRRVEARDEFVKPYLDYYGDRDDDHTKQMRAWADEVDRDEWEDRLVNRFVRGITVNLDNDEEEVRRAFTEEQDGKLLDARDTWKRLLKYEKHADREKHTYALVAALRLDIVEKSLTKEYDMKAKARLEPSGWDKLDKLDRKVAELLALEATDAVAARKGWVALKESLQEERDDRAKRPWYLLATKRARELEK